MTKTARTVEMAPVVPIAVRGTARYWCFGGGYINLLPLTHAAQLDIKPNSLRSRARGSNSDSSVSRTQTALFCQEPAVEMQFFS